MVTWVWDIIRVSPPILIDMHFWHRTIIGYVDKIGELIQTKNRSTQEALKIFKFILNNGDGMEVQCVIWNNDIAKFEPFIKLNNVSEYSQQIVTVLQTPHLFCLLFRLLRWEWSVSNLPNSRKAMFIMSYIWNTIQRWLCLDKWPFPQIRAK